MPDHRMFSKTIIDSDPFIDMPLSTQALYFHLSMRADDDGFLNNPKRIQRMIGASEDDLKVLIVKRFIIPFESGVVVIKHWKMHNQIKKDRYKPTVYVEEKALLIVKENGSYTECIQNGSKVDTICLQDGSKTDTQYKLSKDSIGYTPLISPPKGKRSDEYDSLFDRFWKSYPRKVAKENARKAFAKLKPNDDLLNSMLSAIEKQKKSEQWTKDGGQFIPHPATWLNQHRWEDEMQPNDSICTFDTNDAEDLILKRTYRGMV